MSINSRQITWERGYGERISMEGNKSKGSYRSFDVRRFDGRRFLKSRGGLIFFSRRLLEVVFLTVKEISEL